MQLVTKFILTTRTLCVEKIKILKSFRVGGIYNNHSSLTE